MDPTFLFGLAKIQITRIGIIYIGRDRALPICPVKTKIRITHVQIKQVHLHIEMNWDQAFELAMRKTR